jgi:protein-S-isoprenylcysteine O-methyltransferase Ste14
MSSEPNRERKPHKDRPDLVGEHRYGDCGQIILFVAFSLVWVGDSFIFRYTNFLSNHIPLIIRVPVGIIVLSIAIYFAWAGHECLFGNHRNSPRILRDGAFGRVRHPLYLGSILFYMGLALTTLSVAALVLWIFIFGFYHFIARFEERLLMDEFGEAYKDYMDSVPMWLPRIR